MVLSEKQKALTHKLCHFLIIIIIFLSIGLKFSVVLSMEIPLISSITYSMWLQNWPICHSYVKSDAYSSLFPPLPLHYIPMQSRYEGPEVHFIVLQIMWGAKKINLMDGTVLDELYYWWLSPFWKNCKCHWDV